MSSSSVFSTLISSFPAWSELSAHLRTSEGGSLFIAEHPTDHLAIIRYVKGQSNLTSDHVKAFRSVVWDTQANRPVSVTAFKSDEGENFPPDSQTLADLQIEEFVDGVMIGMFFDGAAQKWKIHTRSVLNATSRYYSAQSFASLFADGVKNTFNGKTVDDLSADLDKTVSYTWILQHPENRIVCPVRVPKVSLVSAIRIGDNGTLDMLPWSVLPADLQKVTPRKYMSRDGPAAAGSNEITNIAAIITMMNGNHNHQGIVVKSSSQPFQRWKIRSTAYKVIRKLRGNTARRDFLWMDLWSKNQLQNYFAVYPEERTEASALIQRWKRITQDSYKAYVDGFKARSVDRSTIPAKLRPFVYGLHNHYLTVLKPARKSLDWAEAVKYMNERDTAQKIYALNWELRMDAAQNRIPLEPLPTSAKAAEATITATTTATTTAGTATTATATTATQDLEEGEIPSA